MDEMDLEELKEELRGGARCILQVRHAERPKMDPDDPTFGDALELTAEGARTATVLGERLREFKADVQFYSSPLTRTRTTARRIAEGMGIADAEIPLDDRLGNGSFYYEDPSAVLDVFRPENFFNACFEYFRTGEQRGFRNLHAATAQYERWMTERFERKLFLVVTHDCYIAAFLAAKGAGVFTTENWVRFLDGGAMVFGKDGSVRYRLVRTGLSEGICGVGNA